MLLTDGCVIKRNNRKSYFLVYYGKDAVLHRIFKFLVMSGFGGKPSCFLAHHKRAYRTVFERGLNSKSTNTLFSLTPSFKTSPGQKNTVEYATMQSPKIEFLSDESFGVKVLAFRLAMSADGNVAIINAAGRRLKFRLRLGCAHPTLAKEWGALARELKIPMNLAKDKNTWSGIQGLNTDRKDGMLKFSDYGGFINGVKAHKSRRYRGFEKNAILFGIRDLITGKSNHLKEAIEKYEAGSWGSLAYPTGLRSFFDGLPNGT